MGYFTDFEGRWTLNKKLDEVTYNFLIDFSQSRRMGRRVDAKYGVQGEFYVDGSDNDRDVVDGNLHPITQPSLWCQWIPTLDRIHIEWDGGEKFYEYVKWIEYLISKVLAPRGYILNETVKWRGESFDDIGTI